MDWIFFINGLLLPAGLLGSPIAFVGLLYFYKILKFRSLAKRYGLIGGEKSYRGSINDVPVVILREWPRDQSEHLKLGRLTLVLAAQYPAGQIPVWITCRRGAQGSCLGDRAFDRWFEVRDPLSANSLAFCVKDVRAKLLKMRGMTSDMEVTAYHFLSRSEANGRSGRLIEHAAEFVQQTHITLQQVPKKLAYNVQHEDNGLVRVRNMMALLIEFPNEATTCEIAKLLLTDKSPGLRFLAAVFLGPRHQEVIEDALVKGHSENEMRWALSEIADQKYRDPGGTIDTVLPFTVEKGSPAIARIAWQQCRARSIPIPEKAVLRFARECIENDLVEDVVNALAALSHPHVESLLILMLEGGDIKARPAARSLGEIGSIGAVEPLLRLIKRASLYDVGLRTTAREAIAKIQSRLSNAERGTLSLAETAGPEGAVSLAPQGGEVSEASPPKAESRRESDSAEQETS